MLLQIENENNEKKDYIKELISFFYSIHFFFLDQCTKNKLLIIKINSIFKLMTISNAIIHLYFYSKLIPNRPRKLQIWEVKLSNESTLFLFVCILLGKLH